MTNTNEPETRPEPSIDREPGASTHSHNSGSRSRRRGRSGSRPSRRSASHAAAEAADHHHQPIPDHPLIPDGDPLVIDDAPALAALMERVRAVGQFAYDTEFIGEESYFPFICLIQIATPDEVALIDPLNGLDLTPIWELIADPGLETIVHAGQQDLEPVVRHLGRPPQNILDTQLVAGFADRPYPLGLRPLVEEFVHVKLGKGLTFTRWDARPLSKQHARYAADDVRYLPALAAALHERLAALGHEAWAIEECAALSDVNRYRFDAGSRLARLMGNRNLKRREMAIVRELLILRDQVAREQDVPPRSLLRDDVLIRLAREPAKSTDALASIKGFPRPLARSHGEQVLESISRAKEIPARDLPERSAPEESPADRLHIDTLWSLIGAFCGGRGIDPSVVTSRREIARLYQSVRKGESALAPPLDRGWRRELLGDLLQRFFADHAVIDFRWTDRGVEPVDS